jgi:4-amino-4-deoxy-L-arabinose transferase-like glycosyltransferase
MLSPTDYAPSVLAESPTADSGGTVRGLDSTGRSAWIAIAAITALAATLRLVDLGSVRVDPFYDAAVRSMTLSWHNFFFGAFEPGGSVSIDKPPLDLWLQVASVKLWGWSPTTLKLPEALAGTVSVPLLFAAIRRVFGVRAGLAAALAMAVLPIEVITARSDTMDAVMMALLVLALLLLIRAGDSERTIWLLGAAAALGLAFNVKLLESLVALPGLAVLAYLGRPHSVTGRRRALQLLAAAAVFVAVALSWLTATSLVAPQDRPFAIGSTNGSPWNAAFVFNGVDRVTGKAVEAQQEAALTGQHYAEATQAERDRIPITPPSPTRLLDRVGPLSGERLGLEILAALLLGLPALIFGLRESRDARERTSEDQRTGQGEPMAVAASATAAPWRLRRATGIGLVVWMATGIALFSDMTRLHPRYVEDFTPAVAALLGVGAAWATGSARGRVRPIVLGIGLAVIVLYSEHLLFGLAAIWWVTSVAALLATVLCALVSLGRPKLTDPEPSAAHADGPRDSQRWTRASAAVLALTLLALLAIPASSSVRGIREKISDAGNVGAMRPETQRRLSDYLRAHQGTAHYEMAAASATKVASLIVQDARPVLVLTTYNARTLTGVAKLKHLITVGAVRYAFLDSLCGPHTPRTDAGCAAPARWVKAHGIDVSHQAGLGAGMLWRLPRSIGS